MENNELSQLIEQLNTIEHAHIDLVSIGLDYTDTYFRHNDSNKALLESLWDQPSFLNQVANSVRESVILATQALILSEDVPFDRLIEEFVQKEDFNKEDILKLNPVQRKDIKSFLISLRREVFSRIYQQNKDFKKFTELKKSLLQSRYDQFMDYFPE